MKNYSKEHSVLIEDIGLVLEERADLSPLAARIYSTLILSSDDGLLFEDITEMHHASKSSVSNNLNVLVKLKYIEYYTKVGERKKFYRAAKYYVKTALEKYNDMFEKELEMLEKINSFNKINNPKIILIIPSTSTMVEAFLSVFFITRRTKISKKPLIINNRPMSHVIANKFSSGKLKINTPIIRKMTPITKLDHLIRERSCINFTPK